MPQARASDVPGNPEPPAGARGGPAETRLLLDKNIEVAKSRGDRGRHSGGAGADDQRIALIGSTGAIPFAIRHAIVLVPIIMFRKPSVRSVSREFARRRSHRSRALSKHQTG